MKFDVRDTVNKWLVSSVVDIVVVRVQTTTQQVTTPAGQAPPSSGTPAVAGNPRNLQNASAAGVTTVSSVVQKEALKDAPPVPGPAGNSAKDGCPTSTTSAS